MVTRVIRKKPLINSIVLIVIVLPFVSSPAFSPNKTATEPSNLDVSGKAANSIDISPTLDTYDQGTRYISNANTSVFSIISPDTTQLIYLPLLHRPCIEGYLPKPLQNGDFEQGHAWWVEIQDGMPSYNLIVNSVEDIFYPYDGIWMGYSGNDYYDNNPPPSSLMQTVTVPVCKPLLSFYYQARGSSMGRDTETVTIDGYTVYSWNMNHYNVYEWTKCGIDLSNYAGQTVELAFNYSGDERRFSGRFFIDNITFEDLSSPYDYCTSFFP